MLQSKGCPFSIFWVLFLLIYFSFFLTNKKKGGHKFLRLKTRRRKSRDCELKRVKPPWPFHYSPLSLRLSHPPPSMLTTLVPPLLQSSHLSFPPQGSSLLPNAEEQQSGEGLGLRLQRRRLTTYPSSSERIISKMDVILVFIHISCLLTCFWV